MLVHFLQVFCMYVFACFQLTNWLQSRPVSVSRGATAKYVVPLIPQRKVNGSQSSAKMDPWLATWYNSSTLAHIWDFVKFKLMEHVSSTNLFEKIASSLLSIYSWKNPPRILRGMQHMHVSGNNLPRNPMIMHYLARPLKILARSLEGKHFY